MKPESREGRGIASVTKSGAQDPPDPAVRHDPAWLDAVREFSPSPRGPRAAVAILSDAGCGALRRLGHDRVALRCLPAVDPARVRFVDPAVAGALSALADDALVGLFAAPWPDLPVVLAREHLDGSRARFSLRVPPDLRALRGHFPAMPLVPGVILVGWALDLARSALAVAGRLSSIESAKFQRIVQPGHLLSLSLDARDSLRFSFTSDQGVHSTGRLILASSND